MYYTSLKSTQLNIQSHRRLIMALRLGVQYLDSGVKRRSVLLLEAGSDVQHVHLAPRHHHPHQGAVISSSALNIETYSAAGGGV